MNGFQKIVLIGAVILLVITLIIIGVGLSQATNNTWPPIIPYCPDYWVANDSNMCVNVKDLGTCPAESGSRHLVKDFNTPAFTGENELCNKYTWAKSCNVTWDGITYGVENPCNLSS